MTCKVDGCGRAVHANGWCNRHNENWRRTGNPIPRKDWSVEQALYAVGWTVAERGCHEWKGKRNADGYGLFTLTRAGFHKARAHRVVYEALVGPLGVEQVLRHRCDNPPCVNPAHLEPGTQLDNVTDMVERGRHWKNGRTECANGHDLTLPGAVRRTTRENLCVECARKRARDYARRKRAMG